MQRCTFKKIERNKTYTPGREFWRKEVKHFEDILTSWEVLLSFLQNFQSDSFLKYHKPLKQQPLYNIYNYIITVYAKKAPYLDHECQQLLFNRKVVGLLLLFYFYLYKKILYICSVLSQLKQINSQ